MSNSDFLQKGNISMLWDVISDEEIFKFLPRDLQLNVSQMFINNVNGFFEVERKKTNNLVEINKKYIILILNHIKNNFQKKPHNKIKILEEEPVKEVITYEEIHNERKSQFEKDLVKRQEEFTNAVTVKVPEVPEFTDKQIETPIKEMDKIIKEMTAKRNYDVEQINRNYQSDINSSSNWLKSQETSIKSEKITKQNGEEISQNQNYSKSKYLHTFNEFVESPSKKNVSWGDSREINSITIEDSYNDSYNHDNNGEIETNIFKKLKKVDNKQEIEQKQEIDKKQEFKNNISLTLTENTNEMRISHVENEIKIINNKLDTIINLLSNK